MLLSSHILSEVEALCDRVTIIRTACLSESGTFAELRHLTRTPVASRLHGPRRPGRLARVHDASIEGNARGSASTQPTSNAVLERLVRSARAVAGEHPSHAGGALPAPLRRPGRPPPRLSRGCEPGARAHGRRLHRHPRLTRLALRRDRFTFPAWWVGLGLFVAATTALFVQSLAVHADLVVERRLVATNAGMRLLGLTSGPSVGGYLLHREYLTLAVLAALMSTFAVIRHTRQNEELGRAEMLASTSSDGTPAWPRPPVAVAATRAGPRDRAAIAVNGQPVEGSLRPAPRWPPSEWSGSASRR